MTLECFALCRYNNSVLSFIILWRVLKTKKKIGPSDFTFEMISECFAAKICTGIRSVLLLVVHLSSRVSCFPRNSYQIYLSYSLLKVPLCFCKKNAKAFQVGQRPTLECFALCRYNNSVLSFIILWRVLKTKKKIGPSDFTFEMISECFAVCKNSFFLSL